MTSSVTPDQSNASQTCPQHGIWPQVFAGANRTAGAEHYLSRDTVACKLVEFFDAKGLAALKQEDRSESWYDDWLSYQTKHRLYASLLAPAEFSKLGVDLNLLRITRFLELF